MAKDGFALPKNGRRTVYGQRGACRDHIPTRYMGGGEGIADLSGLIEGASHNRVTMSV